MELFVFKIIPSSYFQQTVFTKAYTRVYAQLPTWLRTLHTSVSPCCIYSQPLHRMARAEIQLR